MALTPRVLFTALALVRLVSSLQAVDDLTLLASFSPTAQRRVSTSDKQSFVVHAAHGLDRRMRLSVPCSSRHDGRFGGVRPAAVRGAPPMAA